MSDQTQADSAAGQGSRASRIGSRIVVILLWGSVALLLVQAFGPKSWRAGNPVFGPEGGEVAPPPAAETPAAETPEQPAEPEDGKSAGKADDPEQAKDGAPSSAGPAGNGRG